MIKTRGFFYAGKHSFWDFNTVIEKFTEELPKRNRIIETVPHSNIEYDFSEILGKNTYSRRKITYELAFLQRNRERLRRGALAVVNWLENTVGSHVLRDDLEDLYHFRATVAETSLKIEGSKASIIVVFSADPYRIPNNPNLGLKELI